MRLSAVDLKKLAPQYILREEANGAKSIERGDIISRLFTPLTFRVARFEQVCAVKKDATLSNIAEQLVICFQAHTE